MKLGIFDRENGTLLATDDTTDEIIDFLKGVAGTGMSVDMDDLEFFRITDRLYATVEAHGGYGIPMKKVFLSGYDDVTDRCEAVDLNDD